MIKADELISVAESLPLDMKVRLIERLLDSLNPSQREIEELWAEEAEKRIEELKSGKAEKINGKDVFKEIGERLSV